MPGGVAFFGALSCGSARDCSAGGAYATRSLNQQAFIVSETHGGWGKAIEVPGVVELEQ